MLLGQVFGTAMNVTTRLLEVEGNKGKGLHPFQILFARMGITFVLASGYMWWKKTPHFPLGLKEVRGLLVARGLGGFCGVFGMYYSLLYLPLADATVITFLAPSLACWACSILIKEPFTRVEQVAGLVSLVGVVFIAKPTSLFAGISGSNETPPASGSSDSAPPVNGTSPSTGIPDAGSYENVTPSQRLQAVGIALIGVLGSACAYTTIRWIGKRAHPLISVNYFAAWCFLVSIVMQAVLPGVGFVLPADMKEWGYLIFLGVCGFIMVSNRQHHILVLFVH
jgi:drug/metabolite transporter (DMT)-like permease